MNSQAIDKEMLKEVLEEMLRERNQSVECITVKFSCLGGDVARTQPRTERLFGRTLIKVSGGQVRY